MDVHYQKLELRKSKAMKKIFCDSFAILLKAPILACVLLSIGGQSLAQTTNWTDWDVPPSYPHVSRIGSAFHDGALGNYALSYEGDVLDPNNSNTTVELSVTGEVRQGSFGANGTINTYAWGPAGSYPLGRPSTTENPTQTGYLQSIHSKKVTVEFSTSVTNPVLALGSLGNGSASAKMLLSRNFVILAGATNLTKSSSSQGYELTGLEGNGIIQLCGSFDSSTPLEYTITQPEAWFTVSLGLTDVVDSNLNNSACGADISIDDTVPVLSSSTPADGATSVGVGDSLVLTFSEDIAIGTGNIVISDGVADTRTIPIGDAQISIVNTTLTINPTTSLSASTGYSVQIDAAAIDDLSGNSYAGIADATTLNFETAANDTTAPTLASSTPTDNATGVSISDNIVLTFSEAVDTETGNIVLYNSSNVAVETFDVASSSLITGSGTTTIAINPTSDLSYSTGYYMQIAATAFDDAAGNSYAGISDATTLNFTTVSDPNTPAIEFARHKAELTEIIQSDALRSLRGSSASQQRLSRDARDRIVEVSRQNSICDEDQSDISVEQRIDCDDSAENVAINVDGSAQLARGVLSTRGTFFELLGDVKAGKQRLFYGDFDLQRDADGDTTASFNAKMAWEQQLNDASLWGYFVGGSFGNSDIGGTFEGSNDKLSLEAGLYGAHNLGQNLYIDGYAAVGLGGNDLELDNGVLVLDSKFTTRSFTTGMALSGVYAEDAFEVRPELAVNYGKTWIGDVGFTGQAYGLTDGTLSLDAGSVELGTITLRPEFIIPLDQRNLSQSNTNLSVSPRFMCEGTRQNGVSVDHCGSGAELGLGYSSDDGLGKADIKLMMDNIAGGTRSSWNVSIEQKF